MEEIGLLGSGGGQGLKRYAYRKCHAIQASVAIFHILEKGGGGGGGHSGNFLDLP